MEDALQKRDERHKALTIAYRSGSLREVHSKPHQYTAVLLGLVQPAFSLHVTLSCRTPYEDLATVARHNHTQLEDQERLCPT